MIIRSTPVKVPSRSHRNEVKVGSKKHKFTGHHVGANKGKTMTKQATPHMGTSKNKTTLKRGNMRGY